MVRWFEPFVILKEPNHSFFIENLGCDNQRPLRSNYINTMTKESKGKGKARKRSPVKLCYHGKRKSRCRDCGTAQTCPHGKLNKGYKCFECFKLGIGGKIFCVHSVYKSRCTDGCGGSDMCIHKVNKSGCSKCGGSQRCVHGTTRSKCAKCTKPGEGHICEHGRPRSSCKPCGGSDYCEHGKQKTKCDKGCGGSQICEHGNHKYQCQDCGGSQLCDHGKQRHACDDCNSRFCFCCEIEKTAAVDAMCQTCLSKIHGTSIEEIHLTSMMCHALYGDGEKLEEVSVKKINGSGIPFDMVFTDISEESVVVIEHDPVFYHQGNKTFPDTKKVMYALDEGCVIIRHRHVECPKIEFEHDDFHLVEFDGYSSKSHSGRLAVSIVEYMINMGVLNESCMERAFYFLTNPEEFSEISKTCANEFIRKIVLS